MSADNRPLIIAARPSRLSRTQAEWVGAQLAAAHDGLEVVFKWIESEGDQLADVPLADAGGKGLFARAVERALLSGDADVAVHSMKDLPVSDAEHPDELTIAAVPPREDVRDCLIARDGVSAIDQLKQDAVVGTAGPRRAAQLLHLRPDLKIELIRGNVETRLRKVLEGDSYDATLMAVAGLNRLGLSDRASNAIDVQTMLPAAAQGALAIQCRRNDQITIDRAMALNHSTSCEAVHLERGVVEGLQGDCHSPIAVLAETDGDAYRVRARVLSEDGRRLAEADETGQAQAMVERVMASLRSQGAVEILHGQP
jgi:hydroxymethylbilane synthase